MSISVTMDATSVIRELDRLAAGPSPYVGALESVLLQSFMDTQAVVHVRTGYLKGTGRPESEFDGEVWTGTLAYARNPGIFELARGKSHYFFDPAYRVTPQGYENAIEEFLRGDSM